MMSKHGPMSDSSTKLFSACRLLSLQIHLIAIQMYRPAHPSQSKRLIDFRKKPIAARRVRLSSTLTTRPKRSWTIDPITPCNTCTYQSQVPSDLEIDRVKPLSNTVPYHNQHIVISTGKSDWESRIENESQGDNLARELKDMTKRASSQDDVCHILLVAGTY